MENHTTEFRDAIYHYLLHYIESNEELISMLDIKLRTPMKTEARDDLIAATTNQYEWWIQNNKEVYKAFAVDGIANFTTAIEELLQSHPPEGKTINARTIKQWQSNLKPYFDKVRHTKRIKGKPTKVYLLLDKFIESLQPSEEEPATKQIDLGDDNKEEEENEE